MLKIGYVYCLETIGGEFIQGEKYPIIDIISHMELVTLVSETNNRYSLPITEFNYTFTYDIKKLRKIKLEKLKLEI
jgi:hypothetical protein